MRDSEWMGLALCREVDPELFFPDRHGRPDKKAAAAAISICGRCPVIAECGAYRLEVGAEWGVWAGVKLPKPRHIRLTVLEAPHGTERRYKAHLREGTEPCVRCREAANLVRQERKERRQRSA